MFQINDKVVCVVDCQGRGDRSYPGGKPQKGSIYVVNGVVEKRGIPGLFLVGVPSLNACGVDCGWKAMRFRKLSDIQQENKLMRQMQTSPKQMLRNVERYFPKL